LATRYPVCLLREIPFASNIYEILCGQDMKRGAVAPPVAAQPRTAPAQPRRRAQSTPPPPDGASSIELYHRNPRLIRRPKNQGHGGREKLETLRAVWSTRMQRVSPWLVSHRCPGRRLRPVILKHVGGIREQSTKRRCMSLFLSGECFLCICSAWYGMRKRICTLNAR
jgi:hypothetical protein